MGGIIGVVEDVVGGALGGSGSASASDIGGALGNAYGASHSGGGGVKQHAMGAQTGGLGNAVPQMQLPELIQMIQPRLEAMQAMQVDRGMSNPFMQFMLKGAKNE
jgi:hypothetical protein